MPLHLYLATYNLPLGHAFLQAFIMADEIVMLEALGLVETQLAIEHFSGGDVGVGLDLPHSGLVFCQSVHEPQVLFAHVRVLNSEQLPSPIRDSVSFFPFSQMGASTQIPLKQDQPAGQSLLFWHCRPAACCLTSWLCWERYKPTTAPNTSMTSMIIPTQKEDFFRGTIGVGVSVTSTSILIFLEEKQEQCARAQNTEANLEILQPVFRAALGQSAGKSDLRGSGGTAIGNLLTTLLVLISCRSGGGRRGCRSE